MLDDGLAVPGSAPAFCSLDLGADCALRKTHGGGTMSGVELAALLVAAALFLYLMAALLKPEWFA
jgi:K+-transporting ATPase KdpF subunit